MIEDQIEIDASAHTVWSCLMDFPSYPQWNPLIPLIEGQAALGSYLKVRLTPPALAACNYTLKVTALTPQEEFSWLGHLFFPGWMDGDHTFIIKTLSENKTLFIQREKFSGILVPFLDPFLKKNMLEGFKQMNLKLKQRAES